MHKIVIIIVVLAAIGFVGSCLYLVAGVSATIPPIKKYEFSGTVDQLLSGIRKYAFADTTVTLKIIDTTGDKNTGYGIEMDIEIKSDKHILIYNLKCEKNNGDYKTDNTLIQLIGAFNKKDHNVGGYGIKGVGVSKMVNEFDTVFLTKLKRQYNMNIIDL